MAGRRLHVVGAVPVLFQGAGARAAAGDRGASHRLVDPGPGAIDPAPRRLAGCLRCPARPPPALRASRPPPLLIAANWFVYVLAVTSGHVLDASLGYFLCPLVNVALGVLVLKERLTRAQLSAVGARRVRRAAADRQARRGAEDRPVPRRLVRPLRPAAQAAAGRPADGPVPRMRAADPRRHRRRRLARRRRQPAHRRWRAS